MEEIIEDIEEIASTAMSSTTRIYLTGGNPFALPTHKLIEVFDAIESRMPQVNSYGGFCRIIDIANKSDEELALLAARGVDDVTIGAESGYDDALDFMEKGHSSADIIEQAQRLHKAGIEFTFFYLVGMAGSGQGERNAIETARTFSAAVPKRVLVVCMTPTAVWPLKEDIVSGRWIPPTEVEMAQEIRAFIARMSCECYINCSHDTDIIKFDGGIPYNQEGMLQLLDHRIPKMNEKAARRMRELLHHATF